MIAVNGFWTIDALNVLIDAGSQCTWTDVNLVRELDILAGEWGAVRPFDSLLELVNDGFTVRLTPPFSTVGTCSARTG